MVTNEITLREMIMEARRIKKILFGLLVSDASLDKNHQRFDLYTKHHEYAEYVQLTLNKLTHTTFSSKEVFDKRFGVKGYRVWSTKSKYLLKAYNMLYLNNGRKRLSKYVVDRLDEESLAHIWMCDGYLEHSKNRKLNKVQNIGWFCLEAYPKEELQLFQDKLKELGIETSLVKKPWGFGYRVRVGGEDLQKFVSLVFPYILDCFKYKTTLFYKRKETALLLPSAEHYVHTYDVVDDIVRHSKELEKTIG